jgi:hypothetical protein
MTVTPHQETMDATSSLSPKLTRETPSSKKIQKFPPNHNQDGDQNLSQ